MALHYRSQAVWKRPPTSARALLRRLEFILGNTIVDDAARTRFRWRQAAIPPVAERAGEPGSGWKADPSGYDGWLAC
jgi:hypothetical protein